MPRPHDHLFEEHRAISERCYRLASAAFERAGHSGLALHKPHAAPTATGRSLEHHGIPEAPRDGHRLLCGTQRARTPRYHGDAQRPGELPRPHLVAEERERRGGRPDKRKASRSTTRCEVCALRKKPVARVNAVTPAFERHSHKRLAIEIRLDRRSPVRRQAVQFDRAICEAGVESERIGRGVYAHRLHAEAVSRACDAYRDFAAVGDEHPLQGACFGVVQGH